MFFLFKKKNLAKMNAYKFHVFLLKHFRICRQNSERILNIGTSFLLVSCKLCRPINQENIFRLNILLTFHSARKRVLYILLICIRWHNWYMEQRRSLFIYITHHLLIFNFWAKTFYLITRLKVFKCVCGCVCVCTSIAQRFSMQSV